MRRRRLHQPDERPLRALPLRSAQVIGDDACPFTTLYWDFLARHKHRFSGNLRMKYPYLNLARRDRGELAMIRQRAAVLKKRLSAETFL